MFATGVSTTPAMTWTAVNGADRYWVMVATSASAFPTSVSATNCPSCVSSGFTNTNSYTWGTTFSNGVPSGVANPPVALKSGATYYWVVQGFHSGTPLTLGAYSSPSTFTTTPLPAPTLNSPANGVSGVSTTPALSWSSVTGADRYWVLLSASSTGFPTSITATSCPSCISSGFTNTNSYTWGTTFSNGVPTGVANPPAALTTGSTYFWKVQGFHSGTPISNGNFSSTSSFIVGSVCTYSISGSSSYSAPADGGSSSFSLTTQTGCDWTANSNQSWVTLTSSNSSGTGSKTINFTVSQNQTSSNRNAEISVQGLTFSISQPAPAITCSYTVPSGVQIGADAVTGSSFSVQATPGCNWTATRSQSHNWISITQGASGSGNGTVGYSVAENPNATPREGVITVSGQNSSKTYTISQAGKVTGVDLVITPPSTNISSLPGGLAPNAAVRITYGVKNVGTASAGKSITSIFLSSNSTYDPGVDTWLADADVPIIAAGNEEPQLAIVKIPSGTVPGDWYIILIADAPNTVTETNNSNNANFVSAKISSGLTCDQTVVDDYPWQPYPLSGSECNIYDTDAPKNFTTWGADPWSFYKYQCVSYVAWKVNQFLGTESLNLPQQKDYAFYNSMISSSTPYNCEDEKGPGQSATSKKRLSDACYWDGVLGTKFLVNETPAVGAIAHWDSLDGTGTPKGHVAFVHSVSGNSVCYTNYNGWTTSPTNPSATVSASCKFGYVTANTSLPFSASNRKPTRYIHIETSGVGAGFDTSAVSVRQANIRHESFEIALTGSNGAFSVYAAKVNYEPIRVRVFSSAGKLVLSSNEPGVPDSFFKEFSLASANRGYYLVMVEVGKRKLAKGVAIMR